MITCIIARASAPSVPGRIGMCQSARCAVRWRIGSMQTTLAPRFWASAMIGQRCRFVEIVFEAQMMMYLECTMLSGSTPAVAPTVAAYAVQAPESQ